ncbi:hypothetical protein ACFQZX_12330 [Mucilaginibacter litoreus]|uniref:Phosphatidate cytidylyltransferase n=1 Tax=Mucilaginibacter litoreus TaxID=1048221 RepID=A0ABW3AVC2_9SPHI
MKKINILLLALTVFAFSGCEVVGGIFKAGAAVGIISVVVVILLIWWLISSFRGRS